MGSMHAVSSWHCSQCKGVRNMCRSDSRSFCHVLDSTWMLVCLVQV